MKLILSLIVCTLTLVASAQNSIELKLESHYLHFPVSYDDEDDTRLELVINDKIVRGFDIFLPDSDPDFWVFLDISQFKGTKAVLRTHSGENKVGLDLVYQSDDRKYLENLYKEKLRPQLHFSTMRGWTNDPNGLIYYDGEYHLFYQHNPYGWDWGNMHWGHAVSTDLIHWKQLPDALYPDKNGVCFSGCAVIDYNNTSGFKTGDENVMVAVYTSVLESQTQSLAYSNDKGRTWNYYEGNPVIDSRDSIIKQGHVRDPNVFWHEPTKKWVMILFEEIGHSIFTSGNLKEWEYQSHFNAFWECPELFELPVDGDKSNTKWVTYGAGGYYALGDFDGKEFKMTDGIFQYVHGEFYAAQTYENIPADDNRQIQVGWATIESPGMPFNMMMAFPTELTLLNTSQGVRMFNEPVKEIELLHTKSYIWENIGWQEANEHLKDIHSDLLHIKCDIENIDAISYEWFFGENILEFAIPRNQFNYVQDDDTEISVPYMPELDAKTMTYEIIIDKTSIEVFVDKGRFTMVYPRNLESEDQLIRIQPNEEHEIMLHSLEVYEMKSIWD